MSELSCQKSIGKACFKAFPAFARRAIAYRLLHLLIPPDIAKLLPTSLSDPLIAPGVQIPLDAKFPPGTCIVPGCSFPAGWDPDQDPPECAKSAPLPTLAMIAGGGNPNVFLSPGPNGPLPVQAPSAPEPEDELWLNEQFNDLTTYDWDITEIGSSTVTIVSERLRLYAIGDGNAAIELADARAVPLKMDIKILNEIDTGGEDWYFFIGNASYMISVHFYAKWDQVSIWNGSAWHDITGIDSIEGESIVWKFSVDGDTLNLYRDDVIFLANFTLPANTAADGKMMFISGDVNTAYADYYTIEDLS